MVSGAITCSGGDEVNVLPASPRSRRSIALEYSRGCCAPVASQCGETCSVASHARRTGCWCEDVANALGGERTWSADGTVDLHPVLSRLPVPRSSSSATRQPAEPSSSTSEHDVQGSISTRQKQHGLTIERSSRPHPHDCLSGHLELAAISAAVISYGSAGEVSSSQMIAAETADGLRWRCGRPRCWHAGHHAESISVRLRAGRRHGVRGSRRTCCSAMAGGDVDGADSPPDALARRALSLRCTTSCSR